MAQVRGVQAGIKQVLLSGLIISAILGFTTCSRWQRDGPACVVWRKCSFEMCSGSEAGSCSRLIDFVYHLTLGLRVKMPKKRCSFVDSKCSCGGFKTWGNSEAGIEMLDVGVGGLSHAFRT